MGLYGLDAETSLALSSSFTASGAAWVMDAQLLPKVFRQLFSHETCSKLRYIRNANSQLQRRSFSYSPSYAKPKRGDQTFNQDSDWQQRIDLLPEDRSKEFEKYPLVTADSLRAWKNRPRKVKMLTRDFIEGK